MSCGCSPGGSLYAVASVCICLLEQELAGMCIKVARKRRQSKTSGMGMCPNVASIQLGFLPLNHILGRNAILMYMRAGGYITFVRLASCLHTAGCAPVYCSPHAVMVHGSIPGCEVCSLAVSTVTKLRCLPGCMQLIWCSWLLVVQTIMIILHILGLVAARLHLR